jgi:hypothetical protein
MIDIHLYFNISKLIYSFIGRRDKYFILVESLGSALSFIIILFFGKNLNQLFNYLLPTSSFISNFLFPLFCGLLLIMTSIISRLIVKANPEELSESKNSKTIISVGIIDFAWLVMLGAVYTAVLYCSNLDIVTKQIIANQNIEYYRFYFDEVNFMFGKSIDMILLLGSILAICMSILWGGEIWRKRDNNSRKQYLNTTIASIKMVVAYFIIAISVALWFILPIYEHLTIVKNFVK